MLLKHFILFLGLTRTIKDLLDQILGFILANLRWGQKLGSWQPVNGARHAARYAAHAVRSRRKELEPLELGKEAKAESKEELRKPPKRVAKSSFLVETKAFERF